jgi:hypothetical protein
MLALGVGDGDGASNVDLGVRLFLSEPLFMSPKSRISSSFCIMISMLE